MTLEDLGNIGEFVGAIGVVASLIYLALQIRQNSRLMEQNTRSSEFTSLRVLVTDFQQFRLHVAGDAETMRVWREGLLEFEALNEDERWRFGTLLQYVFSNFWMQWQSVELDLSPLDNSWADASVYSIIRRPGARSWWRGGGHKAFPAEFQRYVNDVMSKSANEDDEAAA